MWKLMEKGALSGFSHKAHDIIMFIYYQANIVNVNYTNVRIIVFVRYERLVDDDRFLNELELCILYSFNLCFFPLLKVKEKLPIF